MPKIKVIKPFKFAHQGIHVEAFEPGPDPVDTTDECADVAVAEGWAKRVRAGSAQAAPEQAAAAAAPETRAAGTAAAQ